MARYTGGVWQDIQGIIVCTTYVRKLMFPEGFLYGCVVTHPRSTDQRVMEYLRARTERSEACTCVCIIVCNVYGVWLDIQGIIVCFTYVKNCFAPMIAQGFVYGCMAAGAPSAARRGMNYLHARTERSEACRVRTSQV